VYLYEMSKGLIYIYNILFYIIIMYLPLFKCRVPFSITYTYLNTIKRQIKTLFPPTTTFIVVLEIFKKVKFFTFLMLNPFVVITRITYRFVALTNDYSLIDICSIQKPESRSYFFWFIHCTHLILSNILVGHNKRI